MTEETKVKTIDELLVNQAELNLSVNYNIFKKLEEIKQILTFGLKSPEGKEDEREGVIKSKK